MDQMNAKKDNNMWESYIPHTPLWLVIVEFEKVNG
jgi:hypothetical protein